MTKNVSFEFLPVHSTVGVDSNVDFLAQKSKYMKNKRKT